MPWDWDKLQKQKAGRGGGNPPQMDEVISKFKGLKGKFPGLWLIIWSSNHHNYFILILLYRGCQ